MKQTPPLFLYQILGAWFRITQTPCCQPPHTFRILVLGDSFTYGLGVPAHQTFPAQLQAILNRRYMCPFIEVLNVGRPGLNLIEEWALLRQLNRWVEYDLLLLCLSSDDAQPWSKIELARITESWEINWKKQWNPGSDSISYTRQALKAIVNKQRTNVVVIFYEPSCSDPTPTTALSEICQTLRIPFLDLATLFRRFSAEQIRVSTVDAHPSTLAHRIAAVETVAFLQPFLPERAAHTVERLETNLLARIDYYMFGDDAQPSQPSQIVRAYCHLADSLNHAAWADSQVLAAIEHLRYQLNSYFRTYQYLLAFPHKPYEFSELSEALFRLERYLLLAGLGVKQVKNTLRVIDLSELVNVARGCLTQLEDLLKAPSFSDGESETGSEIITMINRLSRKMNQQFLSANTALVDKVREFIAVCQNAIDLAGRHNDSPRGQLEAVLLVESITTAILTLLTELEKIRTGEHDDQLAELLVEVQVPDSCTAVNVNLIGTYTIVYPYTKNYRQIHYVIRDGTSQIYRLDIPMGTIGYFHLELEFRYHVREEGVRNGKDYIKSVVLEHGEERHPYKTGELLYSPLPKLNTLQ